MGLAQSQSLALPGGFSVEFTLDRGRLEAVWAPDMPSGNKANALLPAYRAARNRFLRASGANVLVIEL